MEWGSADGAPPCDEDGRTRLGTAMARAETHPRAHLPIDGSIGMPAVARASCPWVWVKPSDMGKMPMPLAPPSIGKCAPGYSGADRLVDAFAIFVSAPPLSRFRCHLARLIHPYRCVTNMF